MFSNSCEYALRAMLYLVSKHDDGFIPIGEISQHLGISFHFLTKTFQKLTEVGILKSHRGPHGGISLNRAPEEITLKMIVVAIDGDHLFTECILGLPACGNEKPCPMHQSWLVERSRLETLVGQTTLAMMARRMKHSDFRLSQLGKASMCK